MKREHGEFFKLWKDWQRDLPPGERRIVEMMTNAFISEIQAGYAPKRWDEVLLAMATAAMPKMVEVRYHTVPDDLFEEPCR